MSYFPGVNHDALVNRLVAIGAIKTAEVEQAFRAVDRALFVPESRRSIAYADQAIHAGEIHMSAPHFYARMLEQFDLHRSKDDVALTVLNVGLGSGYLSCLMGFLIGSDGVNYSVEANRTVYEFGRENASRFYNESILRPKLCPVSASPFNGYALDATQKRYDRIFCGAACPKNKLTHFVAMLKINGKLIVPCEDEVLKITRLTEMECTKQVLGQAYFSPLSPLSSEDQKRTKGLQLSSIALPPKYNVPVALPQSDHSTAEKCLARFRALYSIIDNLTCGRPMPDALCFVRKSSQGNIAKLKLKNAVAEVNERAKARLSQMPPELIVTDDEDDDDDDDDETKTRRNRKYDEERHRSDVARFWETVRGEHLWLEMLEHTYARRQKTKRATTEIDEAERRRLKFIKMCKNCIVLTGDRFGREVYHDSLRSAGSSARRQRRYFMHPMMMEFYEGMIDDSLSSESSSDDEEKKKKSDRDDRRGGRGPDRMMMMMMMMGGGGGGGRGGPDDDGPELDGLDDEERDFVMNELPRMMSYGRRSRRRRRGDRRRPRLTPYEAEREKYENHFDPATTSLTFHVVAAMDDDWPSYTDASDMGYPRRRGAQGGGRSSAFFPFDMMPDFAMRRRGGGGAGAAASPDDHEDPFADSFDVDVAAASTPKRSSPKPANKEPDVLSSMTALSAIQKKKDDVDGVAVETTGKDDDDDEEDRVRKSAAKLARSKKRKAMLVSLRKKAGIYKPGDVYPLVPDWHYMCMLLHPPSDAWTFEHDEELARFITKELEPSRGALTLEQTICPEVFEKSADLLVAYPKIASFGPVALTFRAILLKRIGRLIDSILHLVAGVSNKTTIMPAPLSFHVLENSSFAEDSFAAGATAKCDPFSVASDSTFVSSFGSSSSVDFSVFRQAFLRPQVRSFLLLSQHRWPLIHAILKKSETKKRSFSRSPVVNVDRRLAVQAAESMDGNPEVSVFMQVFNELKKGEAMQYRWPRKSVEQWWEVKFIGEGIIDQGGGFRDSLSEMAEELCPPDFNSPDRLPFFVKTANQRDQTGDYQDGFIPNPSCQAPELYRWIGKLMGAAFRSDESFTLSFPPFVWKQLLGTRVTWAQDYVTVDHRIVKFIDEMDRMDEQDYVVSLQSSTSFSVELCDQSVLELAENGSDTPVLSHQRKEYCDLVRKVKILESEEQITWMREGFLAVVPEAVLSLISWEELEIGVCGDPDVKLVDLQSHCHYFDDATASSEEVRQLWKALGRFTSYERSRFVRFVTGRKRLPATIVIAKTSRDASEDSLPTASTCANTLYLPKFSSDEMAMKRLRYAIHNCVAIDTDTNPW